ncbi:hypothetical protein GNI_113690 [Gregarina niphandrodes]|uniref:Uncharacterized protein n=1 Tax=Gregarina niphandrodes TaxID=110365 RepID=A0A023B3A8_GRENI|nr:hypothetical protein GNI_113690 [Gregarina niphandrodes]EZG55392.1 hypothetical protein GNI_113690 [Gregarina niphandrodes]|eukprot:XP_011131592.1 hypothetical protein GNI_113690 [Gregarina niphandrodes]
MISGIQATLALAKSTALTIKEEWSQQKNVLWGFRPYLTDIYERYGGDYEPQVDRGVLDWLDDIFESLDTITDFPPPSDYKTSLPALDLQQMLRDMRKLCILRYTTVPKVISEDDFWIWVHFGIETKLNELKSNTEVTAAIIKTYIHKRIHQEEEVRERTALAAHRARQELSTGGNNGITENITSTLVSAPEKTQQLISKFFGAIKTRGNSPNNVQDPLTSLNPPTSLTLTGGTQASAEDLSAAGKSVTDEPDPIADEVSSTSQDNEGLACPDNEGPAHSEGSAHSEEPALSEEPVNSGEPERSEKNAGNGAQTVEESDGIKAERPDELAFHHRSAEQGTLRPTGGVREISGEPAAPVSGAASNMPQSNLIDTDLEDVNRDAQVNPSVPENKSCPALDSKDQQIGCCIDDQQDDDIDDLLALEKELGL